MPPSFLHTKDKIMKKISVFSIVSVIGFYAFQAYQALSVSVQVVARAPIY